MKTNLTLLSAIAAGIMCLVSCQPEMHYYTTYMYEAKLTVNYGTTEDVNRVGEQLKSALNNGRVLFSPADETIKESCAAIQKQYQEGKVNSVYFKYVIYKHTQNSASDQSPQVEELAAYEFGEALNKPYAFYVYVSDITDARARLREFRGKIDDELYKECGQLLLGIETAFSKLFEPFSGLPYEVTDDNDKKIKEAADDLFDEYSSRKNGVIFTYIVARKDVRTLEATELWKKAFPINVSLE